MPTRKDSIFNLGSAETKLLYTLHWVTRTFEKFKRLQNLCCQVLLDAGDECALEEVGLQKVCLAKSVFWKKCGLEKVCFGKSGPWKKWALEKSVLQKVCLGKCVACKSLLYLYA